MAAAVDSYISTAFEHNMENVRFSQNGFLAGLVAVLWIGCIVLHILHQVETGQSRHSV